MTNDELKNIITKLDFNDNCITNDYNYCIFRYTQYHKYLGSEPALNCIITKDKNILNVIFYCLSNIPDATGNPSIIGQLEWNFNDINKINSQKFENDLKEMLDYILSIQKDIYRHTISIQQKMVIKSNRISPIQK